MLGGGDLDYRARERHVELLGFQQGVDQAAGGLAADLAAPSKKLTFQFRLRRARPVRVWNLVFFLKGVWGSYGDITVIGW